MTTDRPENFLAFPNETLRDYFAAKAMEGLLANPDYFRDIGGTDSSYTAKLAYAHADAMLKARDE